jgi:hypothetical protein
MRCNRHTTPRQYTRGHAQRKQTRFLPRFRRAVGEVSGKSARVWVATALALAREGSDRVGKRGEKEGKERREGREGSETPPIRQEVDWESERMDRDHRPNAFDQQHMATTVAAVPRSARARTHTRRETRFA